MSSDISNDNSTAEKSTTQPKKIANFAKNVCEGLLVLGLLQAMGASLLGFNMAFPLGVFCLSIVINSPQSLLKQTTSGYLAVPITVYWPFAEAGGWPKPLKILSWMFKHDLEKGEWKLRAPFQFRHKSISRKVQPYVFWFFVSIEALSSVFLLILGIYLLLNHEKIDLL